VPDLTFTVDGVSVVSFAASPTLAFRLGVSNRPADERIHAVVLRVQLQLDVTRRRYVVEEEALLGDLFGDRGRWGQTLRSLLWTHATVTVPPFAGTTSLELPVPCTFDFNVAATKYFYGLVAGDVPLTFLFSGSVFYDDGTGALRVVPISWDKEAAYRLPVRVWRELMDEYYPNTAWLALRRDAFERLYRYKLERGIPTWEQLVETVLAGEGART
jgi:hypothetical protein